MGHADRPVPRTGHPELDLAIDRRRVGTSRVAIARRVSAEESDLVAAVDERRRRSVDHDESQAPPHVTRGCHEDVRRAELGRAESGEPAADGLVTRAIAVLDTNDFVDPHILRAAFRHDDDRVGRDVLREGRFRTLRFPMGVRTTARLDELRDGTNGPTDDRSRTSAAVASSSRCWPWAFGCSAAAGSSASPTPGSERPGETRRNMRGTADASPVAIPVPVERYFAWTTF